MSPTAIPTRSPRIYLGPEQWILMSQISGKAHGGQGPTGSTALACAAGRMGVASFPVSYEHLAESWNGLDGRGRQMLASTIDQVSRGVEIEAGDGGVTGETVRTRRAGELVRTTYMDSRMRRSSPGVLPESSLIAAAVAHCDVVVVDRHWVDGLEASEMGDRCDTRILTSLDELVPYLVGL